MSYAVVFQLDQETAVKALLSQTRNVIKAIPGIQIEWVIHGIAVKFFRREDFLEKYQINEADSAIRASLAELKERYDIRMLVCKNAMVSHKVADGQLLREMIIIPSGVAEIIKRQTLGWSYIRVVG